MEENTNESCLRMSTRIGKGDFINLNCSSKAFFMSLSQFWRKHTCNDTSLPNLFIIKHLIPLPFVVNVGN